MSHHYVAAGERASFFLSVICEWLGHDGNKSQKIMRSHSNHSALSVQNIPWVAAEICNPPPLIPFLKIILKNKYTLDI